MKNKNILLIDDDDDDQMFFTEAVNSLNLKCDIANNGIQGTEYLKNTSTLPDIIFLDLNMPKMNGYEFLAWIKSMDLYKDIPVVIFTTSKIQSEKEKLYAMGASYFFSKPADFKSLVRGLIEIIHKL